MKISVVQREGGVDLRVEGDLGIDSVPHDQHPNGTEVLNDVSGRVGEMFQALADATDRILRQFPGEPDPILSYLMSLHGSIVGSELTFAAAYPEK
jgi:hypothetical protein